MLKGISPLISPELLKILCEMGHGDEIVLGDANFPAESCGQRTVRADGIGAVPLLEGIMDLMPLDDYDDNNFALMAIAAGDDYVPEIWDEFDRVLQKHRPGAAASFEERFAFYERAKKAYAVVATGETAIYANVILKKGVIK